MVVRLGLLVVASVVTVQAQSPPPPPSVEMGDGFGCYVEIAPDLIGGIAALQAATVYPEAVRAEGIEGRVVVQFVVQADGGVTDLVAVRSPDPRLTEAAFAAIRAVRFKPGLQRGRPIAVRFAVPVAFRLP